MSKPSVYVIAYNDELNMRACLLGRMAMNSYDIGEFRLTCNGTPLTVA